MSCGYSHRKGRVNQIKTWKRKKIEKYKVSSVYSGVCLSLGPFFLIIYISSATCVKLLRIWQSWYKIRRNVLYSNVLERYFSNFAFPLLSLRTRSKNKTQMLLLRCRTIFGQYPVLTVSNNKQMTVIVWGGGGEGVLNNVLYGGLRLEAHTSTLLYTSFDKKVPLS